MIDGGEWLKTGQEFGHYTDFDRAAVKQVFQSMKKGR